MTYGILRNPHQNARYYDATRQLIVNELDILLKAFDIEVEMKGYKTLGGLELFCFDIPEPDETLRQAILKLSSVMAFFKVEDNHLIPMMEGKSLYFKDDLASILKYSGKTNEDFTAMMINVGIFSSDFAKDFDTPLMVFDPMSGRGTSLFRALILGYNSMGVELSKNDCVETNQFLKRYLKYHHYKHDAKHQTIMLKGKNKGTKYTIETADSKEAFKKGDTRTIQYASGNTLEANLYYKKESAHIFVTDLPYGVQHSAGAGTGHIAIDKLMAKAAPVWYKMLKKGGAGVIAYNTYHLKREDLAKAFEEAGFTVLSEAPYDAFEHWVEQAVNRDILVVKK